MWLRSHRLLRRIGRGASLLLSLQGDGLHPFTLKGRWKRSAGIKKAGEQVRVGGIPSKVKG